MKQSTLETPSGSLPVTRDLTQAYNLSLIVALLITAASLGGLLFSSSLYPTDELRQSFLTNDLVNLLIGLPVLLGSMWLARRGKLVGLLCWPGAHLYIFYNYLAYLVGVPFSLMTLVFAALLMVSGYLMFDLVRKIDREALKTKLAGAVVEKLSGGILILFGAAFFGLAVGVLSTPSTGQSAPAMSEVGVAIADITLSVFLFSGGVLLFRQRPLGYASGLGLLFAASALFISVILVVLLQPVLTEAPFSVNDVIVLSGMAVVCFIPTGLFLRGVLSKAK